MSQFEKVLDKAVAEISIARALGEQYAEAALIQARYHINIALDGVRKKAVQTTSPNREQV